MQYRHAQHQDISTLNHISRLSKQHWGYPQEWMKAWEADLRISPKQLEQWAILLAELDGKTIGFCAIEERETEYEIEHLWLLPSYIGKGYGKQLLLKSIETFAHHPKSIIVTADPNAEAFYASQGFIRFDQVESYPQGRFLPLMRKAL